MRSDFFYNFKGFHNCNAKCHIRILYENRRPLVIICSECPDNMGTSVCNAFEIIYKQILTKIKKDKLSKELDEFNMIYANRRTFIQAVISYILESIKKTLKSQPSFLNKIPSTKDLIWVEHWPEGTFGRDQYFEVKNNGGKAPKWDKIDLRDFSQRIGYKLLDIDKSNVEFEM